MNVEIEDRKAMGKGRLEAFSDGVLAIIITIMVLELKVPRGDDWGAIRPLLPVSSSYVLSYLYVGIYWNNHHHLLHACKRVTARILWANLHLLFWLSLLPFVTGWAGSNHQSTVPQACYGLVLLFAGIAYWLLQNAIIASEGPASPLRRAVGRDFKGNLSMGSYAIAVFASFWNVWIAQAIYVGIALIWVIPDKRIEAALQDRDD